MTPLQAHQLCAIDDTDCLLMRTAMLQLQFPARAYNRVLRLDRTVADIPVGEDIGPALLAKAIQYRPGGIVAGYWQQVV